MFLARIMPVRLYSFSFFWREVGGGKEAPSLRAAEKETYPEGELIARTASSCHVDGISLRRRNRTLKPQGFILALRSFPRQPRDTEREATFMNAPSARENIAAATVIGRNDR
jgi:hypothetical protein